jgi:hypothetical protein
LLSNEILHELDKELERRVRPFFRYANKCNIYVKSKKLGNLITDSLSQLIEKRLKLKVHREKSFIVYSTKRKFLGFSFYWNNGMAIIRVHAKPIKSLKARLKELNGRSIGSRMEVIVNKLNQTIQGSTT